MSRYDPSPFSPNAQFRSFEGDLGVGRTFRSLAPLESGTPFLPKPSFANKELGDAEADYSLGIQPSKVDSFGMLGMVPRSVPGAELPLVPAWVCAHTSFVVRLSPVAAFTKLLDILRSPSFGVKVDVQAQNDKFQLKGKCVREETMVFFKKKLFRNSVNEVIIECTRQEGCVVLFNKVYQQLLAVFGTDARRLVDTGLSAATPISSFQSFPPLDSSLSSPEVPNGSLLRTLLLRAGSPFLDDQFQACEALVAMSTSQSLASWRELGKIDVLAIVTVLLKAEEDTAHLATVLLMNLLKLGFRETAAPMVAELIALLDSRPTFRNQDTKRLVSDTLRIIVQSRKQKFSSSQRATLEFYQHSSDAVLSANIVAILRQC